MIQLSQSQQKEFFRDGFLVIENVFYSEEIQDIKRSFDRLAKIASRNKSSFSRMGTQFVLQEDRIDRIVWAAGMEPDLLKYSHDSRLLGPVSQLLGSKQINQIICQAHFKFPNDGLEFPWHQDSEHRKFGSNYWRDLNGRGSYVQTITAIDPITDNNGPVRFVPQSCLKGHMYLEKSEASRHAFDHIEAISPNLSPGSVVMFGPYTVHGSSPNRSTRPRRIFINGFCYPGANSFSYPGCDQGLFISV